MVMLWASSVCRYRNEWQMHSFLANLGRDFLTFALFWCVVIQEQFEELLKVPNQQVCRWCLFHSSNKFDVGQMQLVGDPFSTFWNFDNGVIENRPTVGILLFTNRPSSSTELRKGCILNRPIGVYSSMVISEPVPYS